MSGKQPQNCQACRADDRLRQAWGCDAPSEQAQLYIQPCTVCDGEPEPSCAGCQGTGREGIYRCPVLFMPEIDTFLNAFTMYRKGYLPEAGGLMDQPHTFIEACLILDSLLTQESHHARK